MFRILSIGFRVRVRVKVRVRVRVSWLRVRVRVRLWIRVIHQSIKGASENEKLIRQQDNYAIY